jgi:hypothetical protein
MRGVTHRHFNRRQLYGLMGQEQWNAMGNEPRTSQTPQKAKRGYDIMERSSGQPS